MPASNRGADEAALMRELGAAQVEADDIKHMTGIAVAPQAPLPVPDEPAQGIRAKDGARPMQSEQPYSLQVPASVTTRQGDGFIKAASPMELPHVTPDNDITPPSPVGMAVPAPRGSPRVPSGVLLCGMRGASDPTAAPTTSLPRLADPPVATPDDAVHNALHAAVAGAHGMEMGPAPHHLPSSPPLRGHAFRSPLDAATHTSPATAPRAANPQAPSHSSGTGSLSAHLSRVAGSLFGAAATGPRDASNVPEEASRPQLMDPREQRIIDSDRLQNLGPPSDRRHEMRAGHGSIAMVVGSIGDRISAAMTNVVEAGATMLGDPADRVPPGLRPSDLPGMPGTMQVDEEVREVKSHRASEALQSLRDEVAFSGVRTSAPIVGGSSAATAPLKGADSGTQAADTDDSGAKDQQGGGMMSKVTHAMRGLFTGGGDSSPEHDQQQPSPSAQATQPAGGMHSDADPTALPHSSKEMRATNPKPLVKPAAEDPSFEELETPPVGEGAADARRAQGIPAAALADAERSGDTGVLSRSDPKVTPPDGAPDFSPPNFFKEVGRRGLGDVVSSGVDAVKGNVATAIDQLSHGGPPAPYAVHSLGGTDSRDVARNVERVGHLDDPVQARIYAAETYKVPALHPQVVADKHSPEERAKEESGQVVLGKNKPHSGAPHRSPADRESTLPQGAQGGSTGDSLQQSSDPSIFSVVGTAKGQGLPDQESCRGRVSVREASAPFLSYEEAADVAGQAGSAASSWWGSLVSAVLPTAKAVTGGGAAAGTPTGTDRTQKPPTATVGDDTSGRPPEPAWAGKPDQHDVPTAAPKEVAPHAQVHRARRPEEGTASPLAVGQSDTFTVPRPRYDVAGSRENASLGAGMERLEIKTRGAVDALPDTMARVGESVGGALQHVLEGAHETLHNLPQDVVGNRWPRDSEQKQMAKEAGDEEEGAFDPYSHPGGTGSAGVEHGGGAARVADLKSGAIASVHRQEVLAGMMEEPDPARKRDTFMDKVLYPFTKDAGDPGPAIDAARSYFEYVAEKEAAAKGEMDPHEAGKRGVTGVGMGSAAGLSNAGCTGDNPTSQLDATVGHNAPGARTSGPLNSIETLEGTTSGAHTASDYVRGAVEHVPAPVVGMTGLMAAQKGEARTTDDVKNAQSTGRPADPRAGRAAGAPVDVTPDDPLRGSEDAPAPDEVPSEGGNASGGLLGGLVDTLASLFRPASPPRPSDTPHIVGGAAHDTADEQPAPAASGTGGPGSEEPGLMEAMKDVVGGVMDRVRDVALEPAESGEPGGGDRGGYGRGSHSAEPAKPAPTPPEAIPEMPFIDTQTLLAQKRGDA